jgi:hypothetical protein
MLGPRTPLAAPSAWRADCHVLNTHLTVGLRAPWAAVEANPQVAADARLVFGDELPADMPAMTDYVATSAGWAADEFEFINTEPPLGRV